MKAVLLLALLTPIWLGAQIRLWVVRPTGEESVGESFMVGTVPAGLTLDTTFRLRNVSSHPVTLSGLNVAGQRFSLQTRFDAWPLELGAGAALDFVVRFHPLTPASYTAFLNVNGIRLTTLLGIATPSFRLYYMRDSSRIELLPGEAALFGTVAVGQSVTRSFELVNPLPERLSVFSLSVSGASFRLAAPLRAPLELSSGRSVNFEVAFTPVATGLQEGRLEIDGRSYVLRGAGEHADFPRPQIWVEPVTIGAGKQVRVGIRLAEAPRFSGAGELGVSFTAAVPGPGTDPGIVFLPSNTRTLSFTVTAGQTMARFGDQAEAILQTGTTAGTVVLTARLGAHTERLELSVPPGPVVVDSTRGLRSASNLELQVAGFDTSRTASRVTFTFFDREGKVVRPGAIPVDVRSAFQEYFRSSSFGGLFLLRAVFPVVGNGLRIVSYEIEMANQHGVTKVPRTMIP
ncbi:MAG: choice-of-anchor D domain-containing protein [Bryobacterales bacterium]|nr:choice-of-anchor D domain-containing protein [Bryobacteraceae bacterium]MDW8355097.1 choice-of-anchor D domain-containing protein [Bryobacterales bacterium]